MWNRPPRKSPDEESGVVEPLYPAMVESPELRWGLIRKIYSIVTVQILLTVAVASVVVFVPPVTTFFVTTTPGLVLYIFLIIFPFIVLCPLYYYYQKHPVNLLLLGLFTVAISFAVGLTLCFYQCLNGVNSGLNWLRLFRKVILEAAILTAVVVVSLTIYTFWAAKRGHDFNFLGPFLFAGIMALIVFGFIQLFFPLGKITTMIYGGIAALIFCGYIIYDTDNIIKRYSYDEYVWASVALYLDIINLFLNLLTIFRAAE
ncbi:Bax inhibitor-1 family protein [Rhynchospora pubera]|uniref:Bax inhibitor-1 family protein n=1 Tax=Rhynchospora pubera TaxID=906938 RepID=A0AAV8HRJ9_9POAL|nr:Bax inhibitor-1 family protein [Rhynchospora pubera]